MQHILQNLRPNFGYQIRVLLIPVLFSLFTNLASAQYTSIPDPNFELALIREGYDSDGNVNGHVLTSDISSVKDLDVFLSDITDLTGIQDFSSLQTLQCGSNSLTGSLNLSMLTHLTKIELWDNQLTSINVTGLTNLTYLDCYFNSISSLDVSTLTNLTYLDCSYNSLTSLDVRGLNSLNTFDCTANPALSRIVVTDLAAIPSSGWVKDATATYYPLATWNSAWYPAAPNATINAEIEDTYSEAADITALTLTVKDNATVTIPSGYNVKLTGALTIQAGSTFTLSNNSNLVQTDANSINSGVINVNRNSNALFRLDYTLWSSPVTGTQTLANFSPLTISTRFYTYNPITNLYDIASSASTFAKGTGYLIRMPNSDPKTGYDTGLATLNYPGIFTGVPNNGTVSLTGLTAGSYYAIGNPYPSTISADAFITANGITGPLYFWRKKNNLDQLTAPTTSYATYTKAGGTGTTSSNTADPIGITPSGIIQVGQGFIAKSTSTSIQFTNTMRLPNNANQILKIKNTVERNRIWLNLTNAAGAFSQMLVAYMTDATQGVDAAIDGKYFNDSSSALNSLLNNEEFVIQGRSLPFDGTDIVPLAFKTAINGNFTIAIDHVDGLFLGSQEVYLVDSKTGAETNLKAGAYNFTATAGVDNTRFSLKYQKTLNVDTPVMNDNSVTAYRNNGTLYITSRASVINNVKVFDIQGRLIAEQKNVKADTASIANLKSHQVLIVQISLEDNKIVSKKVLN
ncbi:T9SS sorting signal type C domain-containing protein [Flavobacterium sp. WC2509]|uniref:T9SS sorting signal type C domain-containing protein n=1 Tax=Flavobacterium sp. WC2509 TaxID=3461406 RepID=UPI004044AC38